MAAYIPHRPSEGPAQTQPQRASYMTKIQPCINQAAMREILYQPIVPYGKQRMHPLRKER
jgi:hypothetical protein